MAIWFCSKGPFDLFQKIVPGVCAGGLHVLFPSSPPQPSKFSLNSRVNVCSIPATILSPKSLFSKRISEMLMRQISNCVWKRPYRFSLLSGAFWLLVWLCSLRTETSHCCLKLKQTSCCSFPHVFSPFLSVFFQVFTCFLLTTQIR